MEKINQAVAINIKQLRDRMNISLDTLSDMTGVSKSMLAQIERGHANPTISTVWKIANGLKIPFTQLVTNPEQDAEIVDISSIPVLSEDNGRYRNYPIFPYEGARPFEIYSIELDPGARLQASAHPLGTQEYLLVSEGEVEIVVNEQAFVANPTHAVRFKADLAHVYQNKGDEICRVMMVISYSG